MNGWIRRRLGIAALVILVLLVAVLQASAHGGHQKGTVTVMTRNLYLGTELGPIFSAPTLPGLLSAVGAGYANVQATDFPARATSIAAEIEAARPTSSACRRRRSTGPTYPRTALRLRPRPSRTTSCSRCSRLSRRAD